jgi:hypothetical protein
MRPVTNPGQKIHVQVVDDELIVSLPGSLYSVTYYKPERSPQLLARRIPDKDDLRIAMTLSEFLAKAWRLANDKARELGWIA